eukprot:767735-Hanusia_phi.AAC.1
MARARWQGMALLAALGVAHALAGGGRQVPREGRRAVVGAEGALRKGSRASATFSSHNRTRGSRKQKRGTSMLFDEAYRPQDSRHFSIQASSTFVPETSKKFLLTYADGTVLKGFRGLDVVQLGNFHAQAPFGVVTDCNSPDFNGVDGILGFGLPKGGSEGADLPRPILFALTDPTAKDSNAGSLLRKFAFFSTDNAAELQLGGYDPASCSEVMLYTPSLSSSDFVVGVTSLSYGTPGGSDHIELLKFKSPTGGEYLPAILDSGTSCLVIPGDNVFGTLSNSPFDDFANNWKEKTSFWITFGGRTFEIPYKSWFLSQTQETCVQPSPDGMVGILIGDVFFREYIVEFDMQDNIRPIIGVAKLNAQYAPVKSNELEYFKLQQAPRSKLQLLKGEETMYPAEHSSRLEEVDQIPIANNMGTQYFMDLAIGTPKQPFTVIFDTGSAVFGVFSYKDKLPENIKAQLTAHPYVSMRIDPMNILMQRPGEFRDSKKKQVQGQAVSLAMAAAEINGGPAGNRHHALAVTMLLCMMSMLLAVVLAYRKSSLQRGSRMVVELPVEYRGLGRQDDV